MAFVKDHLKIKNTVIKCDFTSQIASQAISVHLKPKVLLRSMPTQPLDNTSISFPRKLKFLDRTLFSQNMRGQTLHNRLSSSNLVGERGDILYLKTSILGVCSNQVSGIP